MPEPIVPQFDEETFLMWERRQADRFELHHGFVLGFAGGTIDHDRISRSLCNVLDRLFPAPRRVSGSAVKVRVAKDTFYYPDASVFCDDTGSGSDVIERPRVVGEVLSKSTHRYDVVDKRAAYRAIATLEAYVVVHTSLRRVELDHRDADGTWQTSIFDDGSISLGDGAFGLDELYVRSSLGTES